MKPLIYLSFISLIFLCSCHSKEELLSDDMTTIIRACKHYGNAQDTSAIRFLLKRSLDPRVSKDLRYTGYSVNWYRLNAIHDISGVELGRDINKSCADTAATMFYVNWAIQKGFVKDVKDADINYHK